MANAEYLITRPGALKLGTVVLGAASFSLSTFSYSHSPYTQFYRNETRHQSGLSLPGTEVEVIKIIITGAFLALSVANLILHVFIYELCESRLSRIVDTIYHVVGALLICAFGSIGFYSAINIDVHGCHNMETVTKPIIPNISESGFFCHHFSEKIIAGIFSVVNGFLYCATAILVYITKDL